MNRLQEGAITSPRWRTGLLLVIGGAMVVAGNATLLPGTTRWRTVSASEGSWGFDIPLDGTAVAPASGPAGSQHRLVLSGAIRCAHDGRTYDAFYIDGLTPHDRLDLPPLASAVPPPSATHRYEVALAPEVARRTLRVNLEKFVDAFLAPPSEVKASLSGGVHAELRARAGRSLVPIVAGAMLMAVGLSASLRPARNDDVRRRLRSVRQHYRAAWRALPSHPPTRACLALKLQQLRAGAEELAVQVRALRNARTGCDRAALQSEIDHLQELVGGEAPLCAERALALAEKRGTLAALEQLARSEACCLARLDRTAAALQSAGMKLQGLHLTDAPGPHHTAFVDELAKELDALEAASEELRARDRDALGLRRFDLAAGTASGWRRARRQQL